MGVQKRNIVAWFK